MAQLQHKTAAKKGRLLCFADQFANLSASQCGFCTPGFVVATHHALSKCQEQGVAPTAEHLQKGMDGNLCRCTGYRPILDACKVQHYCVGCLLKELVCMAGRFCARLLICCVHECC